MGLKPRAKFRALAGATLAIAALLMASTEAVEATALSSVREERAVTPWPGGVWTPPAATFGSAVESQVSVTMSDGVQLRADIAYPTDLVTGQRAAGPFPILLTQTPYRGTNPRAGDYFVQRGYIFVTAYVRGTTTSGGSFGFFSDRDAKDGAELVNWVARHVTGSNGKVGLYGGSYAGLDQMYTAAAAGRGSPIKALAPTCMGAEFYRETYFAGGIPTQTLNFQRVIGNSMGGNTAPSGAATVADIEAGGDKAYDRKFWEERTVGNLVQKVVDADVPALLWSSNGDIYAQSSFELYAQLQNTYARGNTYGPMSPRVPASGRYQIIISQGGHCANQNQNILLEWFDTWVKGVRTGMDKTSTPVHVNEIFSNRWINTSTYPVVPEYTKYYFDTASASIGTAPARDGQRTLPWAAPSASSTAQFDSPVFAKGGTLAGPISANIYASSSRTDLELIATLQAVAADGTVTPLTSGTVLGSMSALDKARSWTDKNGVSTRPYGKYDRSKPLNPGKVNQFDIAISPRFVSLPAGSKLRVVLSTQTSANCNPVLGTDPCFPTQPQLSALTGSEVTIYTGARTPSSVNLPLLKADCWVTASTSTTPNWGADSRPLGRSAPCQR